MKNKLKLRVPYRKVIKMIEAEYDLPSSRERGFSCFQLTVGKNSDLILRIGGRKFTND